MQKQIPNIPNGMCVKMGNVQQTIGKSEATFNLRLNNHREGMNKQNPLQAEHHFR